MRFNGTTIDECDENIRFNGNVVNEVRMNGTTTWERKWLPDPVSSFNATDDLSDGVVCTWTNPVNVGNPACTYTVYRDGAILATNVTSGYKDTTTVNGTTYTYGVAAVNSCPGGIVTTDAGESTGILFDMRLQMNADGPTFTATGGTLIIDDTTTPGWTRVYSFDAVTKVTLEGNLWRLNEATFTKTNTLTDVIGMFKDCEGLRDVDLTNFDISNTTSTRELFAGCYNLNNINTEVLNMSTIVDAGFMFSSCYGIESLDFTGWDTSNCTNMQAMLNNTALTSVTLNPLDTQNVTNFNHFFHSTLDLPDIDVSVLDGSSGVTYHAMFAVPAGDEDPTHGVFNIVMGDFIGSSATDISNLLASTRLWDLDLSACDFTNLVISTYMLFNASRINEIKMPTWPSNNLDNAKDMFRLCINLDCISGEINTTNATDTVNMFLNTTITQPTAAQQTAIVAGTRWINNTPC